MLPLSASLGRQSNTDESDEMRRGTNGLLTGFLALVLMLGLLASSTLVGIWIPLVGPSLHGAWISAPPRKLARAPSSKDRKRVLEPVTVKTFFLGADAFATETVLLDHYQEEDDVGAMATVLGRSSRQSHRRLQQDADAVPPSEADSDAQASKLTRLLIPLVCVAIACLVAASAILLFVVIVRTRNASSKVESAVTVHHVPPIDEASYPLPRPYGDIPLNETMATTNEVSAGTASAGPNVSSSGSAKASHFEVGFGTRVLDEIKRRTRSIRTTNPFVPNAPATVLPQEVHRPNLLTGIYRQQSSVVQADPVSSLAPRPHHHDAVPLSIVSTMTNSFNNETDDDDVLDMNLDLYLGLAAAAASSSSREWMEKATNASNKTDALSAIEEGDSSSRQLVQEIHWQGSSDVMVAAAADEAAVDTRRPQPVPGRLETPQPKPSQHFVDALYSLVAAGVPPQVILGSSFDSTGSGRRGAPTRPSVAAGLVPATTKATGHVPAEVVQDLRRMHSRGVLEQRSARRSGAGPTSAHPASVEPCRGPRGFFTSATSGAPTQLEEGRDDAEDSHAGSSADGRNDSLLEL